ncbi:MAG: hypothetical protein ACLQAT_23195 [Candidatus Binataceae bacterium]
MEKTFAVQTEADFEAFLLELVHAIKLANPLGWPVTETGLTPVVSGERALLPYRQPQKLYLADEQDHVAWYRDDKAGRVRLIHVQG